MAVVKEGEDAPWGCQTGPVGTAGPSTVSLPLHEFF